MSIERQLGCTFFCVTRHSPKLRIGVLFVALLAAVNCDKVGGDKSPTAPSGPPAAGSAITYDASGASDANGVGSSVPCFTFTDCPNGTGYPQVATRQLQAAGFTVSLQNLGIPTAVI